MATIRLTSGQEAKLRYLASRRGTTLAEVYREAIDAYLQREMPKQRESLDAGDWDGIVGLDAEADSS